MDGLGGLGVWGWRVGEDVGPDYLAEFGGQTEEGGLLRFELEWVWGWIPVPVYRWVEGVLWGADCTRLD